VKELIDCYSLTGPRGKPPGDLLIYYLNTLSLTDIMTQRLYHLLASLQFSQQFCMAGPR